MRHFLKSSRCTNRTRISRPHEHRLRQLHAELLEPRNLLAVSLVGHWSAADLAATHVSGEPINVWTDAVDDIRATAEGQPHLITDALNGFSVVRFDPSDGEDLLRVIAEESPMSGVGDFTVAVVFATASQELRGGTANWYQNTGIVDANLLGIVDDWGLAINSQGQIAAGLGRPNRTQYSSLANLNDGGAHVAIYTRSGRTISLYVDGTMDSRTDGALMVRAARDMAFGGLLINPGAFDGDIAEIRLYDTELTSGEANDLTNVLLTKYFNEAPVANDDAYIINEDETLTVTVAAGVLANDSDLEENPITAVIISQPEHGTVNLAPDGSFVYQPFVNFAGTDGFTYAARDARNSNAATVTVEVVEQDDPPVPMRDSYLLESDQAFTADAANGVLANDVNLGTTILTAELAHDVDHGTLLLNSNGSFVYTPNPGFSGKDRFAYQANGGNTTTDPVQVELLVNAYSIVLSEIMAANRDTLADEDGDSSDWIELYNYGDEPVDLDGWYLTDDPLDLTGWRFPSVTLEPSHFLNVFASGKDRAETLTGELHTDFLLSSAGEFLALVAADGQTVVSQFSTEFPPQLSDLSYGIATPAVTDVLVDGDSAAQFIAPADDSMGLAWIEADYALDDNWTTGPAAIGFDRGTTAPDMGEYASTVLADSPVGFWRLEETGGTIAENLGSIGSAANGTYLNGARSGVEGLLLGSADSAVGFQQSLAQKIDVPYVPGINPDSFSFEAWARADGGTGFRSPLTSRGDSPQEGFLFYATPGNTWQMWTGTGQQVGWTVLAGPAVESGKWTHLVGTYDNATKTQRFYVDGVAVASVTNLHAEPNNADPLRIGGGATEGDGNYFFDGAIDEVAVYDHVLPSARIRAHFDAARTDEPDGGVADFAGIIQHDVGASMHGVGTSAYLRVPFEITNAAAVDSLTMNIKYDDGFVAYLNGHRVAERNAPVSAGFDAAATDSRPDEDAVVAESIDLSAHLALLDNGQNVLALHGLNRNAGDDDFLLLPELIARAVDVTRFEPHYLATATPGALNGDQFTELGPVVGRVQHTPIAPVSGEDLIVTAQLYDLGTAVASVRLNYRVQYAEEFSTLMVDDGSLAGDTAGDGIYTGVITESAMAAADPGGLTGKMLRYAITTSDVLSRSFRAPYLVNPLNTQGFPEYFGTVIRDSSVTTALPVFQWFVADPAWHISGGGNNKNWSPSSVFYDGEFYDNVRVRVRGQTTVNWSKPKLKFEFNNDHEFRYADNEARVEEFNLQSHFIEKGAVSYMGENLAFRFLQDIGVPAPNTMHMHVRQNGEFYSLASFIEQIDATFLERNGFDPSGPMYKAFSPSARSTLEPNPDASNYRKVTQKDTPWDDLHEFTDGINDLIPGVDRSDYIFDHVNLPEVINDMAGNIVLINHDRLTKNYYVYRDENGNGEWSRFPWDMDQAFAKRTDSIFASVLYGDSEHPQSSDPIHQNHLYDAILDTPFTREMYLQRIRTLLDEYLSVEPGGYFDRAIDEYYQLIADDAALDNARWGAGNISAGVARLRENLLFRQNQLEADPLVPHAPSAVDLRLGEIVFNPASGNQDEEYIEIVNYGLSAVDISSWRLVGGVELTFQPGTVVPAGGTLYASPNVVAFRARETGPTGGQGLFVQGDYEGHISNFGDTIELVDTSLSVVDAVTTPAVPTDNQLFLRVSEMHYNPVGNDDVEFIELTNISSGLESVTLDLSGVEIRDGPSVPFIFAAGTILEPGGYILVVKDQTAFSAAYPDVLSLVAGEFDGSLSNGGERIRVNDVSGSTIVSFTYGDDGLWPTRADGAGSSLELVDPTATPLKDMDKSYYWRGSTEMGGSPGRNGIEPSGVVISEVLAHTDPPVITPDSIEILNRSSTSVDIGGWFLSDSADDLLKYEIPVGIVLAPGEYRVFDESDFNPTPLNPGPKHFALNGTTGDDVWLVTPDGSGGVASFADDVHFGATPNGQSLSLTQHSNRRLVPVTRTTLGCGGANPLVGDVVISEINYQPAPPNAVALAMEPALDSNDLEYIEILVDAVNVRLDGWRLRGGIEYDFPDVTLSGDSLIVLSFNPDNPANADRLAAFGAQYDLSPDALMLGGYSGSLSDSGERLRLERPLSPADENPDVMTFITVDEVIYDNVSPWPANAGGTGQSIARRAPVFFGNDGASWIAREASPLGDQPDENVFGDLNGDQLITATDIDLLLDAINRNSWGLYYVLSGASPVATLQDVEFLVENVFGTFFGDANLDKTVNALDLNQVGIHWQNQSCGIWETGDFSGDGRVDVVDLNFVGVNWQQAGTVPAEVTRTPRAPLSAKGRSPQQVDLSDDSVIDTQATRRRLVRQALLRRGADSGHPRTVDWKLRIVLVQHALTGMGRVRDGE